MNSCLSAGTSSTMKMELVGHTGTQAPQSMQPSGSTYSWVAASKPSSSFLGWMQSVGQASTQSSSFVQVSVMTYAMIAISRFCFAPPHIQDLGGRSLSPNPLYKFHDHGGGDVGHRSVVSDRTKGLRVATWRILAHCQPTCWPSNCYFHY